MCEVEQEMCNVKFDVLWIELCYRSKVKYGLYVGYFQSRNRSNERL